MKEPLLNPQEITFSPALIADYPIIQNLARFWAYDMSVYFRDDPEWKMPDSGLYEAIDLKKYWDTPDAYPFLIHYRNELTGFVIIDKKGSQAQTDFNMAQFYIVRKFTGQGMGRTVAYRCFAQFPGNWEVMVLPGNEGAYRFWRKILQEYSHGTLQESTQAIAHFKQRVYNIFNFIARAEPNPYSGPPEYDFKQDPIELVAYDPQWPKKAAQEIKAVRSLFPEALIIDIQHVGSTAIPEMPAKPVLDIQIATSSLARIKPIAIEGLKTLGYVYWAENPDPERMLFIKGIPPHGKQRSHHLHIVEPQSRHWPEKLLFRDYLRKDADAAKAYARVKQSLAARYRYDRETYTSAKTKFIHDILRHARRESAAQNLRIEISSMADKQTLDEQIIAYNASQIPFTQEPAFIALGYSLKDEKGQLVGGIAAVLYCWGCLTINTLWVDSTYRGQGYGSLLLKKVEQQAQHLGCTVAHVNTFDFQAQEFYTTQGYVVFGELYHCPAQHKRFYLVKYLSS